MAESSGGRPEPILTIGIPLVILAAAGFFGWIKLIKPALEDKEDEVEHAMENAIDKVADHFERR